MQIKSLSLALMTTALVSVAGLSFAQDKTGQNVSTEAEGESGAAGTLALAYELYAMGVEAGDALTVLTAAKLAASVAAEPGAEPAALDAATITVEAGDTETTRARKAAPAAPAAPAPMMADEPRPAAKVSLFTAANEDPGAADAPLSADAMFAKALELAGEDEALKSLIEDAMAEGSRGRIGGAVTWESKLPAGMVDVWEIPFYGNSYAEVAIAGDGDADLDVVITDENGNVICYDTSRSDQLYCDFVPAWDGYFYVTVENTGGVRNTYYLLTN